MDEVGRLDVFPLTQERWNDLETLFGPRGACGGCWCMFWRLKRSDYDKNRGEGNHQALKDLVESGQVPGLLAYANGEPVGWVSIAPREEFRVLNNSRVLRQVDDQPVWSVVCFYTDKRYRKQGLTRKLLDAAVAYAAEQGAQLVEGYPISPKKNTVPAAFAYTGFQSTFQQAGFVEMARRSETRPIMRRKVSRAA